MRDKKKEGKEISPKLRAIYATVEGDAKEIKDIAFVEMSSLFIEDDGRRPPFLRVVTEKGSYRIKLEKI